MKLAQKCQVALLAIQLVYVYNIICGLETNFAIFTKTVSGVLSTMNLVLFSLCLVSKSEMLLEPISTSSEMIVQQPRQQHNLQFRN